MEKNMRLSSREQKEVGIMEEEEEIGNGCVWPPRPYTCGFCKRQFRCAQALGGHMNVHRRDKARLTMNLPHHHYITILKPTISSSSSPFATILPSSSASPHVQMTKQTVIKNDLKVPNFSMTANSDGRFEILSKGRDFVRRDVEMISLVGTSSKDVDLELRLGF